MFIYEKPATLPDADFQTHMRNRQSKQTEKMKQAWLAAKKKKSVQVKVNSGGVMCAANLHCSECNTATCVQLDIDSGRNLIDKRA